MIIVVTAISVLCTTLLGEHYYSKSQCLVSQTKQLANAEAAVSISMEYSLESLQDILKIYQILKRMDIREKEINNRTFYSVGSALEAELLLGLQVSPYNTSYSLESGPLDYFVQERALLFNYDLNMTLSNPLVRKAD